MQQNKLSQHGFFPASNQYPKEGLHTPFSEELVSVCLLHRINPASVIIDSDGNTLMHELVMRNRWQEVENFLENYFPHAVYAINNYRFSPLMCATSKEMVNLLVGCGAEIEELGNYSGPNTLDTNPLIQACRHGRVEVCVALIEAGADLNAKPGDRTALMAAVERKSIDCVNYLLKSGADKSITDASGRTAEQIAKDLINSIGDKKDKEALGTILALFEYYIIKGHDRVSEAPTDGDNEMNTSPRMS